jgi:uncharacterized protein YggU (UPF0235/DUF167 family)
MRAPSQGHTPSPRTCVSALEHGAATRLEVRAQPGAKRSGFAGFWNGMPKIAVSAPPEKGRANEEIALEIARLFGLRASAVEQTGGMKARVKVFRLACPPAAVETRLDELEHEKESA